MTIMQPPIPSKSIGGIIAEANNLSADQVAEILAHQRETGLKFGEAAVVLGYAKREDVLWALSQQFHYPYQGTRDGRISSELVVATTPFEAPAEFFRDIRSSLLSVLSDDSGTRALALCSPDTGDGKSFFAANLAVAFSQLGRRTLLLDADMRTPRQHELFRLEDVGPGLSSVLAGRAETNVIRPIDALPSLYLLPVGVVPPNPLELIQGPAFDLLLAELLTKFDFVVVDTPAASHGADARVTAMKCGASMVIARKGVNRMKALKAFVASLKKKDHRFAGLVMNDYR